MPDPDAPDDFGLWLREFVTPGEPHAILPGRRVCLAQNPATVLSAEQAERLARRLLEAAGRGGNPGAA